MWAWSSLRKTRTVCLGQWPNPRVPSPLTCVPRANSSFPRGSFLPISCMSLTGATACKYLGRGPLAAWPDPLTPHTPEVYTKEGQSGPFSSFLGIVDKTKTLTWSAHNGPHHVELNGHWLQEPCCPTVRIISTNRAKEAGIQFPAHSLTHPIRDKPSLHAQHSQGLGLSREGQPEPCAAFSKRPH